MRYVRNILETKEGTVFSVTSAATVYNALEVMCEKNISAVLVMNDKELAGIFTERDYARKVALKGKSSKDTKVSEIMTKDLVTVSPDCSIEEAMRIMSSKYIRHLPVVEGDKLVGVISIGDVVKFVIDDQQFIIGNLQRYITNT